MFGSGSTTFGFRNQNRGVWKRSTSVQNLNGPLPSGRWGGFLLAEETGVTLSKTFRIRTSATVAAARAVA
jgi:hypothetical protein